MHAHIEGKLQPILADIVQYRQNRPKFFVRSFDIETDRPKFSSVWVYFDKVSSTWGADLTSTL